MNTEAPQGWRQYALSDICERVATADPRKKPREHFIYIDISSIDRIQKRIIKPIEMRGENAPSRARKIIKKEDILVATTRPNLNAVAIVPENLDDQICSTGFCVLRPSELISSEFLFYFVRTEAFIESVGSLAKGALYPAVTDKQIFAEQIPLPPLAEQKRIVAVLNEKMAAVEKARVAALERVEAVRALSSAWLREVFSFGDGELPKRWRWAELASVVSKMTDGNWIESKDQSATGIRLIQTGNIGKGLYLNKVDRARYISEETFVRLNCTEVFPGDVLVSRLPDPVGRACIVPELNTKIITAVDCSIIRFDPATMIPTFFIYYALTENYHHRLSPFLSGATRKRVSRKNLEKVQIPLPPLPEQKRLVSTLTAKMATTEKALTAAQAELEAITALPSALLRKAFSGAL